jgi:catechol 2,3-dioxygenase-like lactoylglutathione lyase family enzyme
MRINHVSVCATDIDAAAEFYLTLFDAEELPHHNIELPLRWVALGDTQLHLFQREMTGAPAYYHFGVTVDDLGVAFARAVQLDALDSDTFGHYLYELPSGQIQLYVKDPSGNLVEINANSASGLSDEVRAGIRRWVDIAPQDASNLQSRLFV